MDKGQAKWVGLTGGIATGKSTVSNYLLSKSIPVIDSDKIAHSILSSNPEAIEAITSFFGNEILNSDGVISRPKLGNIVFNDIGELKKLNSIIHPLVRSETENLKKKYFSQGKSIVVNDIPLLFENNLQNNYDVNVLIYCDKQTQIDRLKKRNNFTTREAESRIKSQMDIDQKKILADIVITNMSSLDALYQSVDKFLLSMKKMS